MILSGLEIEQQSGKGLLIEPFNKEQLNPNSYNLRLHDELVVYDEPVLDMKMQNPNHSISIPVNGLTLQPGKLYLGRTVEYTETLQFVPMLEGRSSVGRLGLFVHVTAGFGDVGFKGFWTLEMFCIQPLIIYPGIEICQVYYHTISPDFKTYNKGKYQNNKGIQASMLYKDFK